MDANKVNPENLFAAVNFEKFNYKSQHFKRSTVIGPLISR